MGSQPAIKETGIPRGYSAPSCIGSGFSIGIIRTGGHKVVAAFRLLKSLVLFLFGAFIAAIIAYYVGKYLESHDLVDVTSAAWGRVMTWVNYLGAVLAQPWFWRTFCGLTGFAIGLYLDAFMRRWTAGWSPKRKWLASYDIFQLADPRLMEDAVNAEAENQEVMERIRALQIERESLGFPKPPLGSGPISVEGEGEGVQALRESVREASLRSSALLEVREGARVKALDDIRQKLIDGKLLARGFKDPLGINPKQMDIPAEYWRFLRFKSDYLEAEGKGIKFTAIVVAR